MAPSGCNFQPWEAVVLSGAPLAVVNGKLPRYLDLNLYLSNDSVPFTQSSNLLFALHAALEQQVPARYERIARAGKLLRTALASEGFALVSAEEHSAPAVVTIALPANVRSRDVGEALLREQIHIAYASDYLLARNWIQACLFGEFTEQALYDFVSALVHAAPGKRQVASAAHA